MTLTPSSVEDVCAALRENECVIPHGRMTKTPMMATDLQGIRIDMTGLSGVSEYEPGEFTFSAYSGTPLREIDELLRAHGQYMPFDPPLMDTGATLGGTVAAGLSGSGQFRYGGVRDFIIGVTFVSGSGKVINGGGKVVKNAAGFDLPKLLVGSMGRLGIIAGLTFKVFPRPGEMQTLRIQCNDFEDTILVLSKMCRLPYDIEAIDIEPPGVLLVRLGGDPAGLARHVSRVATETGRPHDVLRGDEDDKIWSEQREFGWVPEGFDLIKVPTTLGRIKGLEESCAHAGLPRRYAAGGNVAWIACPEEADFKMFENIGVSGLRVLGRSSGGGASPCVGRPRKGSARFASAVKRAFDPDKRLAPLILT